MSDKNRKKNSVFSSKNLIMIGITAAAVMLFAIIMTYIMPKPQKDNRNFDREAWVDSVSKAESEADTKSVSEYEQDAKAVTSDAVPQDKKQENGTDSADSQDARNENKTADGTAQDSGAVSQTAERLIIKVPADGAVLNDYSGDELVYSKTMNDWRTHNGIDFAAEEGSDVLAAADGTVEAITDNGMYGRTIIILHDGGLRTIYSNLADGNEVNIGDNVLSGTVIGKVGNTAAAEVLEDAHLHFEMSLNEETVNPHDYMQGNMAENEIPQE